MSRNRIIILANLIICLLASQSVAQTVEVAQAQVQVDKILEDSGQHFKESLMALQANRRSQSGKSFDKAVEVFLFSTLNLQKDQRLQSCYSQLIETIYRIEFPSDAQLPQIRGLFATCGWRWNDADFKLADAVAQMIRSRKKNPENSDIALSSASVENQKENKNAFGDSSGAGFESSKPSLDEIPSWQGISDRTGVSMSELMAANPGMRVPAGKVFVPVGGGKGQVVKAQAGDTVAKVATRHGADPTAVAKYNGLLPNSVLGTGREIKIPGAHASPRILIPYYVGSSPTGRAEPPCSITSPPVVQNLTLGSTVAEVSLRLKRKVNLKKNPYSIDDVFYAVFRNLDGVWEMLLQFHRGKLFAIDVEYDHSIQWKGISEFQDVISKSLELPATWQLTNSPNEKKLTCNFFETKISESLLGRYKLSIEDQRAYQNMLVDWRVKQELKRKEQERKKQTFKP